MTYRGCLVHSPRQPPSCGAAEDSGGNKHANELKNVSTATYALTKQQSNFCGAAKDSGRNKHANELKKSLAAAT